MSYDLSFAPEFFRGTHENASPRPTSVYQALRGLSPAKWADLARDVFHCSPETLDVETVLRQILETNACRNLDPPVEVWIDPEGRHSVLVY